MFPPWKGGVLPLDEGSKKLKHTNFNKLGPGGLAPPTLRLSSVHSTIEL